jgi:hypothetical protein
MQGMHSIYNIPEVPMPVMIEASNIAKIKAAIGHMWMPVLLKDFMLVMVPELIDIIRAWR